MSGRRKIIMSRNLAVCGNGPRARMAEGLAAAAVLPQLGAPCLIACHQVLRRSERRHQRPPPCSIFCVCFSSKQSAGSPTG